MFEDSDSAPAEETPPDTAAADEVAPLDADARAKEAARGRLRRAKEKLKNAKTLEQLRKAAAEVAGDQAAPSDTKAEVKEATEDTPADPTGLPTPEQLEKAREAGREFWSAMGKTAEALPDLLGGLGVLEKIPPERAGVIVIVSRGTGKALQADAGSKLADAWAPFVARWLPKVVDNSPLLVALAGTGAAAISIAKACQLEARELQAQLTEALPPPAAPPPALKVAP